MARPCGGIAVYVRWDGNRSTDRLHRDFVEAVPPVGPVAAPPTIPPDAPAVGVREDVPAVGVREDVPVLTAAERVPVPGPNICAETRPRRRGDMTPINLYRIGGRR